MESNPMSAEAPRFDSQFPTSVRVPATAGELDEIRRCARAVVYVSVAWSGSERASRRTFVAAVDQLQREHPGFPVEFFVVDEHPALNMEWVEKLKTAVRHLQGYGGIIWLCNGIVADEVLSAEQEGAAGIVNRTLNACERLEVARTQTSRLSRFLSWLSRVGSHW